MRYQSVQPLLPAYNKYMGAVDRLNQVRKTYGFDRKSRRFWIRPFFQFLDYAINNAYLLYWHNCRHYKLKPVELLEFRLSLVRLLLSNTRQRRPSQSDEVAGTSVSGCSLKRVSEMGMRRGRCVQCAIKKRSPVRHTSFGCHFCRVRLCKVDCFAAYHS